ncbi:MAG: hypothetical protein ACFBZ9_02385 [Sphingomonadales bacterium]
MLSPFTVSPFTAVPIYRPFTAMTEDDVALARQSLMRSIELNDGGPVAGAVRCILERLSL